MAAPELTPEGSVLRGVLAVFVGVALLAAVDVASDLREGTDLGHVAVEGAVALLGLLGALLMALRLVTLLRSERAARAEALTLSERLGASEAEAARWRGEAADLVRGLGAAIDQQLERWGLSPAEKEVALLLLKGLSHKELAAVRSVSEATARQQARAVYKKAGLAGRSELAAFFLEDLLQPHGTARAEQPR